MGPSRQFLLLLLRMAFLVADVAGALKEQKFAMEPQDQTAVVGSRVTLPCRVINKSGMLQWTKEDFGLGTHRNLSGFERYTMIGSDEEGDYSLDIYPVTLDDDARYQCQVSPGPHGEPGIRSRFAVISVLVPPLDISYGPHFRTRPKSVQADQENFPLLLVVIGVVGTVIVLIIIIMIIFLCQRQNKKQPESKADTNTIEKQCKESDRSSNISDLNLDLRTGSSVSNVHCEMDYIPCAESETGSKSVITRIGVPLAGLVNLPSQNIYRYYSAEYTEPNFPPKSVARLPNSPPRRGTLETHV